MASEKYLRRQIARIKKEVEEIENDFFPRNGEDLEMNLFNWKQKRDHMIRGIILELHLSIEDVLGDSIKAFVAKGHNRSDEDGKLPMYSRSASYIEEMISGERPLSFLNKLLIARAIGFITPVVFEDLKKLNTIRNKSSHGWRLNIRIRRNVKPEKRKRPYLNYEGSNLYEQETFKRFVTHYNDIYLRILMRLWDII